MLFSYDCMLKFLTVLLLEIISFLWICGSAVGEYLYIKPIKLELIDINSISQ